MPDRNFEIICMGCKKHSHELPEMVDNANYEIIRMLTLNKAFDNFIGIEIIPIISLGKPITRNVMTSLFVGKEIISLFFSINKKGFNENQNYI